MDARNVLISLKQKTITDEVVEFGARNLSRTPASRNLNSILILTFCDLMTWNWRQINRDLY